MSFRIKLFFIFLFYGLVLAVTAQFLMIKINKDVVRSDSLKKAALYAEDLDESFQRNIKNSQAKLKALRESIIFKENFREHKVTKYSQALFLDIAKTSSNIMQLRFIDKNGEEIIRVERTNPGQEAYITDNAYLQNKKNRYYFKDIMKLRNGEFWYSNLDLNIEHGKIERPLKPVLRIGTPFYFEGKKEGILIINIFMQSFLDTLVSSDIYKIYLVDKDEYILVNTEHKDEWNRYLSKEYKKEKKYLDSLNREDAYKFDLHIGTPDDLKIVIIPSQEYIDAQIKENIYQFLWVVLAVVLLSFPLSYLLSIVPAKLNSKVDTLNQRLKEEAQQKDILLSLFDLSDAVLFQWNNDSEWSVSFVSKSVEKLLGYKQDDFSSNSVAYASCIHHDDLLTVHNELKEAIEKNLYFFTHAPYRVITKEKKIKWILDNTVIVKDESGEIVNFVGYLTDITELKEKEFELNNLARIDQLTKISNRLYLDELLLKQYYRFNRYSEECSIILVDIDHFKEVNDNYGHLVGDKILVEFAQVLQNSLRKDDVVGRWGGEEFLIILPHTQLNQAVFLAEKLCRIVRENEFSVVGKKTASFGVATFVHGLNIEQSVDLVDKALYEAKVAGRNMVKVADAKASIKKE